MLATRTHRRLRGVSDLGGYRRCSLLEPPSDGGKKTFLKLEPP